MLDPANLVTITGGLVADFEEVAGGNIIKTRVALDYAGSEKDSDNKSGYFEIVYYLKYKNEWSSSNAEFISKMISEGKMKKGSTVSIVGRLMQERWKNQDGKGASKTVIIVEHMSYAKSGSPRSSDKSSSSSSDSSSAFSGAAVPASF